MHVNKYRITAHQLLYIVGWATPMSYIWLIFKTMLSTEDSKNNFSGHTHNVSFFFFFLSFLKSVFTLFVLTLYYYLSLAQELSNFQF